LTIAANSLFSRKTAASLITPIYASLTGMAAAAATDSNWRLEIAPVTSTASTV